MGGLGLPGDLSSQSRFVRVAFTKLNSLSGTDEAESVSQFFHILGAVDQQRGCCHLGEGKYEITLYTSCCNADRGVYYYTTYDNHQITAVDLHRENLEAFRYVLSISDRPAVWAAWGAIIEKRRYLPDCVRDMLQAGEEFGAQWYCAGAITKKGHPHHPLYLRKDEKLKPFDVQAYLRKL